MKPRFVLHSLERLEWIMHQDLLTRGGDLCHFATLIYGKPSWNYFKEQAAGAELHHLELAGQIRYKCEVPRR